jgi:hypothetical protein
MKISLARRFDYFASDLAGKAPTCSKVFDVKDTTEGPAANFTEWLEARPLDRDRSAFRIYQVRSDYNTRASGSTQVTQETFSTMYEHGGTIKKGEPFDRPAIGGSARSIFTRKETEHFLMAYNLFRNEPSYNIGRVEKVTELSDFKKYRR